MKTESAVDLKQLACDILDGLVFTDRHVPAGEGDMLKHIFKPLAFMSPTQASLYFDRVALLYEYGDQAGELGVNGYPVFFSMKSLDLDQLAQLKQFYEEERDRRHGMP